MNKIINLVKLFSFFVLLLLYSCSSEVEVDNSSFSKVSQEPLRINVLDSSDTRSFISGTSLPDDCVFKIYVYTYEGDLMGENRRNPQLFSSPDGVPVHYKDGICTVSEDIFYQPINMCWFMPFLRMEMQSPWLRGLTLV